MVMSNAGDRNDGEGPSGSHSQSYDDNREGVLESSQSSDQSETLQPHLFFYSHHHHHHHHHNLVGPQQNQMYNNNNNVVVGSSGLLIRVKISWSRGGNQVAVMGSWDNWATREQLSSEGNGFFVTKALPRGEYHYLFIVDGYLMCDPDLPWSEASGNACNVLDLRECDSELPDHLSEFETPESPPWSYNNEPMSEEDYSRVPPEAPPQLLNEVAAEGQVTPLPLPEPQHLNHLYIQTHLETRFLALRSSQRFRQKYVMMVLYKPL